MCMMFSQCNTCMHAQWLYMYLIRYNIKGSVATSRAMPTPFYLSIMKLASSGFMYIRYMSLIIASCVHPRKHHFKNSKTSE